MITLALSALATTFTITVTQPAAHTTLGFALDAALDHVHEQAEARCPGATIEGQPEVTIPSAFAVTVSQKFRCPE